MQQLKSKFLSAAAIVLAFATNAYAGEKISLVTESYPPLNYREGEEYRGISVDQVRLMMKNAGIEYTMEMMPWARALSLATTQAGYCVFTTVHNKERDPKFKWVEPLLTSKTVLMRKAGSGVNPKTLDEAKAYVVGTQRDDFTETLLKENNFPKIDLAVDINLTLKKLMSGRIDLIPISDKYYDKLKREGIDVEAALLLAEDIYSIACNKSVSDETINTLQQQLDRLIIDGTQKQIFEKYEEVSGQ